MSNISSRKIKLLWIEPSQFMSLFKEGLKLREGLEIVDGLPDDAHLEGLSYDHTRHGVVLVVSSDKFKSVKPGMELPVVQVSIKIGQ